MKSSMNYNSVRSLADAVEKGANALSGAAAKIERFALAGDAFGDTASGATCFKACSTADGAARTAAQNLGTTLSDDTDRLRDTVRLFKNTDHTSADEILASARNGVDLYSTHVHASGSDPAYDNDVRGGQIDRLRNSIHGPAIVGGDLNTEITRTDDSARAVRDFGTAGYDVTAGDVGGTSHSGMPIDYVMPRGVSTGAPTKVDGGSSDHDGMALDVAVPRW